MAIPPAHQPPSMPPSPGYRPRTAVFILGAALLLSVGIVLPVLAVTGEDESASGGGGSSVEYADTSDSITRAELLERYAEINPYDTSATPETVDDVASTACVILDNGTSTDELITVHSEVYGPHATEVTRLLVSYQCPEYLPDFQ